MSFDFSLRGLFATPHLRYSRLWLTIGLLGIIGVAFGSVIPMSPDMKSVMMHDKIIHLSVYACLMGWFAQIYRHDTTRVLLAITLIALGIAIEYAQGATGVRHFDLLDMLANTCGVMLAWALAYTSVGNVLAMVDRALSPAMPPAVVKRNASESPPPSC